MTSRVVSPLLAGVFVAFVTLLTARAALLLESPRAFRARNLFVNENALSRT